jgi:hypothetical protein
MEARVCGIVIGDVERSAKKSVSRALPSNRLWRVISLTNGETILRNQLQDLRAKNIVNTVESKVEITRKKEARSLKFSPSPNPLSQKNRKSATTVCVGLDS